MNDTYQNWVERVIAGREAKPLTTGETVKTQGEPYNMIDFVRVDRSNFLAEVGKKGDRYVYHFYPIEKWMPATDTTGRFEALLREAFLEVFKNLEQVETSWVDEMSSWWVQVTGWANNIWGDDLALRAIESLQQRLEGA